MKLNFSIIATLFRNEMRMVVRDRRTIITAVLLPVIVMPLVLFGSSWTRKKREQTLQSTVYRYAVTGSQETRVRDLVAATRERITGQGDTNSFRFEETAVTNAIEALNRQVVHFVIEGLTAAEAAVPHASRMPDMQLESAGNPAVSGHDGLDSDAPGDAAGVPVVRIVFRGDRDDSGAGADRIRRALNDTRRAQQVELLEAHGFPLAPGRLAALTEVDVASEGHVAGLMLGKFITLFLLVFIFSGGAVVANDLLAGEKERGTLETLLTTGAGRAEIVMSKHLVILAVALFITLVQSVNLLVYVGLKLVPASANLAAAVPPSMALLLLVMFLPVAALVAGVLLLTSGYARSYKEAQLYFLPVFLLGLMPALAPLLPGLALRSAIAVVPVANIAVAVREILIGSFDWPLIALSWLVTAGAALWTTRAGVRFLMEEKLITPALSEGSEPTDTQSRFGRQVLRWFAVLWAVVWIVNSYIAESDVRVQVTVNLAGFFFGASVLMMIRYRLNPRETLALRAPKPAVWVGLLGAVPGGLLTAAGLSRLVDLFMPVSSEMLEEFQRALIPEGMSLVQLLLFLAVMPGLFEEIAFRGVLLHGLHRRFHPAVLSLLVGAIFGIFHFALFRLLPTAFLGVLFAAVTLLTGSIFPAMVWHAGNNALGVVAAQEHLPLSDLAPLHYLGGAAMLAAGLWIIWRNRTPYPGLRPWRRPRF